MNSPQRSFLPAGSAQPEAAGEGMAMAPPVSSPVSSPASSPVSPLVSLAELALNVPAEVCVIDPVAAGQPPERARQLADIGFVAGERVAVLTRAWPGNDPLVVLVGHSRFALRSAEAACIRVRQIA